MEFSCTSQTQALRAECGSVKETVDPKPSEGLGSGGQEAPIHGLSGYGIISLGDEDDGRRPLSPIVTTSMTNAMNPGQANPTGSGAVNGADSVMMISLDDILVDLQKKVSSVGGNNVCEVKDQAANPVGDKPGESAVQDVGTESIEGMGNERKNEAANSQRIKDGVASSPARDERHTGEGAVPQGTNEQYKGEDAGSQGTDEQHKGEITGSQGTDEQHKGEITGSQGTDEQHKGEITGSQGTDEQHNGEITGSQGADEQHKDEITGSQGINEHKGEIIGSQGAIEQHKDEAACSKGMIEQSKGEAASSVEQLETAVVQPVGGGMGAVCHTPVATDKSKEKPYRHIEVIESPDWLPKGWSTELKTRGTGSSAGTKDKCYYDPMLK